MKTIDKKNRTKLTMIDKLRKIRNKLNEDLKNLNEEEMLIFLKSKEGLLNSEKWKQLP